MIWKVDYSDNYFIYACVAIFWVVLFGAAFSSEAQTVQSGNSNQTVNENIYLATELEVINLLTEYQSTSNKIDINALSEQLKEIDVRLFNLAAKESKEGRHKESIKYYKLAVRIEEVVYGSDHTETASSLTNIAREYFRLEDYAQALSLHHRALAIREKTLGEYHLDTAFSLCELAATYSWLDRSNLALPFMERCQSIREKVLGLENQVVADDLKSLSSIYETLGQTENAASAYQRAISIIEKKSGPESNIIAEDYFELAELYNTLKSHDLALPLYRHSYLIFKKNYGNEHQYTISARNSLIRIYESRDDTENLLPLFQEDLAFRENALGKDHPNILTSLSNLAGLYDYMGKYTEALPLLERAQHIQEKVSGSESAELSNRINDLAINYFEMGNYQQALYHFYRTLKLRIKTHGEEHPRTGTVFGNLSQVYYAMGELDEAIKYAERALLIDEKALGFNHKEICVALNNLALLYLAKGEHDRALMLFNRALTLSEKLSGPESPLTATIIDNLSSVYGETGDYVKDMELSKRALSIREKAFGPVHPSVALSLSNVAVLLERLGDYKNAEPLYLRAIEIQKKMLGEMHAETAASQSNLAALYESMGDYDRSLGLHQQVLNIREQVLGNEHPSTAVSLNHVASLYYYQEKYDDAFILYQRALAIRKKVLGPDHPYTASSISNLASVYFAKKNYSYAFLLFQHSLALREKSLGSTHPDTANSLYNLAALYAANRQTNVAILLCKRAINGLQMTRTNITGLNASQQKSFLEKYEDYYRDLAGWLIDEGRLTEAQQVMDMLKQQEYFEFIQRDLGADPRTTKIDYTVSEIDWIKRYNKTSNLITELDGDLNRLNQKEKIESLTKQEKTKRIKLLSKIKNTDEEFNRLLTKLASVFIEDDSKPEIKSFSVGQEQLANTQTLLRKLGHNSVLVQYVVAKDTLHILLTTPDSLLARKYEISASDLNKAILSYRNVLQNPKQSPYQQGNILYDILIKPIEADLQKSKATTLMLSLDGSLRYLPIAALYNGKKYMAEKYRLVMYTNVTKATLNYQPQTNWRLAGLGLSQQIGNLSPLAAVTAELEGIVRRNDEDQDGVMPGEIHLNQAFDKKRLLDVLDQNFQVLHIASHFVWQPGNGNLSYLVLGNGDSLTLSNIRNDEFNFSKLDMMTLSACNTGMGSNAGGQEVEGLGTLVQKKGAKTVLATLWEVADESTSLFMQSLYAKKVNNPELTKAEVLQQVQQEFITGQNSAFVTPGSTRGIKREGALSTEGFSSEYRYAHPYYWAPFIMMGNWL